MLIKKRETSKLTQAIDVVLEDMLNEGPSSQTYSERLEQLKTLKDIEKGEKPTRPSADAMLAAGANILGILAIINYERVNVIATKAIGFVAKLR